MKKLASEWNLTIDPEFASIKEPATVPVRAFPRPYLPISPDEPVVPPSAAEKEWMERWRKKDESHWSARSLLKRAKSHLESFRLFESIIVPFNRLDCLPDGPGVYIVTSSCLVLYVGQSGNVRARWTGHQRRSECASLGAERVIAIEALPADLQKIESVLISELTPILNQQGIRR